MQSNVIKLMDGGASNEFHNQIENFLASKEANGRSDNTIVFYRYSLNKILLWIAETFPEITELESVNIEHLEAWAAVHNKAMKKTSYNSCVTVARTFWGWSVKRGLVKVNVAKDLNKLKADDVGVDPFTDEEVINLLAQVSSKSTVKKHRLYILLLFLLECGTRITETLNIQVKHVTLDSNGGEVYIPAENCKTAKARIVTMGMDVAFEMEQWLRRRKDILQEDDYVFCNHFNTAAYDRHNFVSELKKIAKDAGIPSTKRVSPHVFRHTWAINQVKSDRSIIELKLLGGWSTTKMVERYVKFSNTDLRESQKRHSVIGRLFNNASGDKPGLKQQKRKAFK